MTEPATPQPPTAPPVSGTITIPEVPPRYAPQVPPIVQTIDHLGEIIAVAIAGYLCAHGKMSAEMFMGFSIMVLGIQTGIRGIARGRSGPPPSGLVGLAFLTFGAHALHRVIGLGALGSMLALALTGCSGSWEQRAHRVVIATAHAVAVADDTAARLYQTEAARADGGAEFQRVDDRYRRIQGAEEALSATLVRAEALLDAVHDAGGDAGTARCLALRALVQLAADARVFGGVLTAAGVRLSADQAALAHGVAAVIDEMAPRCEGADAGADVVTTDAGGDDA